MTTKSTKKSTKGGFRKGAGRKKGVKNKVTEAIKRRVLADTKLMPLEFLLSLMREERPVQRPNEDIAVYLFRLKCWQNDRLEAAKAAAPYVHPRLESIEHKGDPDKPIKTSLTVEFIGGA